MFSNCTVESSTIESSDGINRRACVFRPNGEIKPQNSNLAIVLVHPYSVLGGCQGLLRGIASGLANKGYMAVTFDMRGVGRSTGRPLTGFAEVKDVISVCKWVSQNLAVNRILLVGSSADLLNLASISLGGREAFGVPIAGSAVDRVEEVIGYVNIGYPFGLSAWDPIWAASQSHLRVLKTQAFHHGYLLWVHQCQAAEEKTDLCIRPCRDPTD
ncbi:hypothetical protein Ancab_024736 [Ancistrocladus abbreviatus]